MGINVNDVDWPERFHSPPNGKADRVVAPNRNHESTALNHTTRRCRYQAKVVFDVGAHNGHVANIGHGYAVKVEPIHLDVIPTESSTAGLGVWGPAVIEGVPRLETGRGRPHLVARPYPRTATQGHMEHPGTLPAHQGCRARGLAVLRRTCELRPHQLSTRHFAWRFPLHGLSSSQRPRSEVNSRVGRANPLRRAERAFQVQADEGAG